MTNIFSRFPKTIEQFNFNTITDISIKIDFINNIKNNVVLFSKRIVRDNEKPEDIAYEEYGDPELYWIILLLNDIINPYYDWILNDDRLLEYVKFKYGSENVYAIHHYINEDGEWCNSTEIGAVPVSNLTHEQNQNEEKRTIKILKREYLQQVLNEYTRIMKKLQNV